jgi:hypothetical protein
LSLRRDLTWLLREIEELPEDEGMALFREACLNDFWVFNRHCLTLGDVLCLDRDSPHYG